MHYKKFSSENACNIEELPQKDIMRCFVCEFRRNLISSWKKIISDIASPQQERERYFSYLSR